MSKLGQLEQNINGQGNSVLANNVNMANQLKSVANTLLNSQ